MLVERRRNTFPVDLITRVGIAWAIVSALLIAVNWSAISTMRFPDPDDTLRLIQVRDWIGGQSWFDVTQYRANTPEGGVPMHWSRLVDAPLALVIVLLTPLLGGPMAEQAALVITPLLTLGTAMLLAARIAWKLLGDEEANLTLVVLAVSVPVLFQLGPMRIDHHGWQLVCVLAALNGLMARNPLHSGWVIGASLATWMMISIEGLPLAAAAFAILALHWLRNGGERALLVHAIQALAITSAALFAATRGLSDLATYCDAISPVHIAMFTWGAVMLTLLKRVGALPVGLLLAAFAGIGAGALGLLYWEAPQCVVGGGFAELDPLVRDNWYINVKEGMPVWQQTLTVILQNVVTPVIGLFAAINLANQSRDWLRGFWTDYALILAASFAISLLVARAGAAACVIAAPPLAWQLSRWLRSIRKMERPLPRAGAFFAVACALLPTLPLSLSAFVLPAHAQLKGAATGNIKVSRCRIEDSAQILRDLPQGEIFAPLDIGPKLLLLTDHSVPATGHHRGNTAMRSVIETALGSADDARAALDERGSFYVALCPNLVEPRNYEAAAPEGFMADLLTGREPDWLTPIETAPDTTFKLWRVERD